MRIESAHIADFGEWHDERFDLQRPVTLFAGPNEAGKSTLLAFFRFMLYGSPPRARQEQRIGSLAGPGAGGELVLMDRHGKRYRLERYVHPANGGGGSRAASACFRLIGEDGGELPEEVLKERLLGGLNAETYRQLFAFGLDELQQVNILNSDEINGYLYSAGLGIDPGAILAAERKLVAEMDQLYKPRGRNQELPKALERLEETRRKLLDWQSRSREYDLLHQEWTECVRQIEQLEEALAETGDRLRWLECCLSAYPHWLKRLEIAKALAGLPDAPHIPQDALLRLEQLLVKRDEWRDKLQTIEWKLKPLLEKRAGLHPDPGAAARHKELAACREAWVETSARAARLAEAESERRRLEQELQRILRQIDRHWTVEELKAFPVSAGERERVRRMKLALEEAGRKADDLAKELDHWQKRAREHGARRMRVMERMQQEVQSRLAACGLPENADPEAALAQTEAWLGRLRQIRAMEEELRHLEARKRDLALLDGAAERSRWSDWFPLAAGGLVQLAVPAVFLWQGEPAWALAGFLVLGLLNAGIYASGSVRFRGTSREAGRKRALSQLEEEIGRCRKELAEQAAVLHASVSASGLYGGMQEPAAGLALSRHSERFAGNPDTEQQTAWAERLEQQLREAVQEKLRLAREAEREAELAREALAQAKECSDALRLAEEAVHRERSVWLGWLDSCHLPGHLSPGTALELFSTVEQGLQSLAQIERLEELGRKLKDELEERIRQAAELTGLTAPERIGDELDRLIAEADRHRKELEMCEQLDAQIAALRHEQAEAKDRIRQLEEELSVLYEQAGVRDESGFRRAAELSAQRRKLEEEARQNDAVLESIAGAARLPGLLEELSLRGQAELEEEYRLLGVRQKTWSERLNALRERKGSLRQELDRMETAEEASELAQRLEEEKAAVRSYAEAWAKRALALALIRETRRKVEMEKQPAVMAAASQYFSLLTAERYRAVDADREERILYAVRRDGERIPPSRLSRGTAEQLFLAVRFALAEEQARRTAVPILMDDIFVNFDQERMNRAWEAVRRLAACHQIVMFTCHEAVAEAARSRLSPEELEIRPLTRKSF